MRIERVSYQKIFPTGMMYLNHKLGVEIQLDEKDNPDEAFQLAKATVEKWNLESNPGMAVAMEYMNGNGGKVEPVERSRDEIIAAHLQTINECKTLRNLEMFASMVQRENEDVLYETYHQKKKELSK
jgi:hypothetical protein